MEILPVSLKHMALIVLACLEKSAMLGKVARSAGRSQKLGKGTRKSENQRKN